VGEVNLVEYLETKGACEESLEWADSQSDQDAWAKCERGDWMLWILAKLAGRDPASPERRKVTLAACACARLALVYLPKGELRPLKAIEAAEAWVRGDSSVTLEDLRKARYATAYAAAADAAYAADAAAYAAYAAYAAAADAAADAADAADAAAAAAAASARASTLKKCADIVRTFYPECPVRS
jgi:hypothetical protein